MNLQLSWRLARFGVHTLKGLFICGVVFPFINIERRGQHIQIWSQQLLRICRLEIKHTAPIHHAAPTHTHSALIVANHISWLDIFVMNSLQPCRFIAKADVRGWPVVGWLVALSGTLFIARERKSDLKRVFEPILRHLHAGERVAFFPEGTSSSQGQLASFKTSLFEAAIMAKVDIQPYAIRYIDHAGALHGAAEYIGETTFLQSMLRILANKHMIADVQTLPRISSHNLERRELAQSAQDAISQALSQALATGSTQRVQPS
jgi:1-acyl-sn-glycerol-3-phosphate acyltransferase